MRVILRTKSRTLQLDSCERTETGLPAVHSISEIASKEQHREFLRERNALELDARACAISSLTEFCMFHSQHVCCASNACCEIGERKWSKRVCVLFEFGDRLKHKKSVATPGARHATVKLRLQKKHISPSFTRCANVFEIENL